METLPKDIQRKLALEFSPPDLINFCLTNKQTYEDICNSKDFWRRKLEIDFPYVAAYFVKNNLVLSNPKNTYIKKFTEVSQKIEKFVKDEFEADHEVMYNIIYNVYMKLLQDTSQNIYSAYINELFSHFGSTNINNRYNIPSLYIEEDFHKRLNKLVIELLNKDRVYGIIKF